MPKLTRTVLLRCFLRTYFINAAYNLYGLQNIGLMHALEPGLFALHGPGSALKAARRRYARHHNSHPFWAPMLTGVFLHMERGIAEGYISPATLIKIKGTTANTLSAIGDSFFGGSLMVTAALMSSCLVLLGMQYAALLLVLSLFTALQCFKFFTFSAGLQHGMAVLQALRRYDLINWSYRIKWLNALLLCLFLHLALPGASGWVWSGMACYLLFAGGLVGKLHIPRVVIALLLLTAMIGMHMAGLFDHIPALPEL